MEIVVLVLWIGIAHLIATAAKKKGYSYALFFIAALFTWLIAGLVVLFLPGRDVADADAVTGSTQAND